MKYVLGILLFTLTSCNFLGGSSYIDAGFLGRGAGTATTAGINYPTSEYLTIPQGLVGYSQIADKIVYGVYVDSAGVIYAATIGGLSISKDAGTTFTSKTTADGLGSNNINDVYVDSAGVIYVGTYDGLSISTDAGASFTTKTTADGLVRNDAEDVYVDNAGVIYVATGGGLSISTDGGTT